MEAIRLPLLPLRGNNFILFPSVEHAIDLARPASLSTINKAIDVGSRIVIGFHKNLAVKSTKARISDFWETGCEATIKGITDLKDGAKRIFVEGVSRVKLGAVYTDKEGTTLCDFTYVEETKFEMTDHLGELFLYLQNLALGLENTSKFSPMGKPVTSEELGKFIDGVTFRIRLTGEEKIRILRCGDIRKRIEMLHILLANLVEQENERLAEQAYRDMAKQNNISLDSNNEVKSSVGTSPVDLKEGELNRLTKLVHEASMSDEANAIASNELQRLQMMPTSSSEYSITVSYLDVLAGLPWNKMTEDKIDINEAKKILDEDHYGLEKPKDRILEFLAVRKLTAKSSGAILCFAGPPGVGKAQPLDAKVLTPKGFVNMGNISIGDKVITPNGQISNVIGVFPQGIKDIYKIRFSDSSYTRVCKEHLWKVQTRDDRSNNKSRIVSTEKMMENLYIENNTRKNYSIENISSGIDFEEEKIDLDPYIVGIILSERYNKKAYISNGDSDIIQRVSQLLVQYDCKLTRNGKYDYRIVKINHNSADNINTDNNKSFVLQFLESNGLRETLSDSKFIPNHYKYCSFRNREKLLQGILDGDGSPDGRSCSIEWSSASYKLSQDLIEVVQSLGGCAYYSRSSAFYTYKGQKLLGKDRHRLRITLPLEVTPFYCNRKLNIYNANKNKKRNLQKYVESITFDGREEAQCILIDHPDHLYVTDNFIVTHNTSLGQSIARAMGRKFIRTSFGGVKDEAEIRGHRRTYIGALPGRIIQEIKKSGTKNPVFMLDEIDKLGHDSVHGDPSAALLEVLDPEQNFSFKDNYLGVGFDLSQVFFIGTANDVYGMPPALRDRMDIVDLSGYSAFTKTHISRHHLIPKQKTKNGLDSHDVNISDEALHHIIESYTYEAGVRTLERQIGSIFRKLAVNVTSDKEIPNPIGKEEVKSLLGPPKLFVQRMSNEPSIGISTGLAWSPSGGSILFVESVAIPGEGKIELTGNMGQVLQESAKASHTWIRANAELFGINSEYAEKASIHVHLPAGATPKDGPSAGVALTVSVTSLLSKIPVRNDIAMTGEISLRGRIMPVGGIVEKLLAAHRAGIREVIIPKDNADSLNDVPDEILKEMKVHLMSELVEAVKLALVDKI